jgi:hypothetical protein
VDAHLGLDLETRREHRKALGEAPRKGAVSREDIGEASAEQAGEQAGEQLVAQHVAAAIGLLRLMSPASDHHVELVGDQQVDHRLRASRIVGEIAVRHQIDVGVDVGEHASDDVALALLPLRADDRSGFGGDLAGPVAAVVVVDVDGRRRQRLAKAADRRADRRFLVEAGQKHGDACRRSHV